MITSTMASAISTCTRDEGIGPKTAASLGLLDLVIYGLAIAAIILLPRFGVQLSDTLKYSVLAGTAVLGLMTLFKMTVSVGQAQLNHKAA